MGQKSIKVLLKKITTNQSIQIEILSVIILMFVVLLIIILMFYKIGNKKLKEVAFLDLITGGMNNVAFQLKCKSLVESKPAFTYTIVLLNVKEFKFINERFGTIEGNHTLKYIYTVLKNHISEEEILARGWCDHFFLCLKENTEEKIQLRLNAMIKDINSFNQDTNNKGYLTILQGAYVIDEPNLEVTIMQDRTRIACNIKGEPDKCKFYSFDLTQKMKEEKELNALFDSSIENNDFRVFLQPKVRLSDEKLCGAEALVRWIHPNRGIIFPSDFIPLFEENGNICKLDIYIFEEVCKLLKKWINAGVELVPISVNISRRHFKNLNFLRTFLEIKDKYHIPDGIIELELTESIFFDSQKIQLVKNAVEQMHEFGFLCSLDDFGVGFSSLALLKEFNVDAIKLDRQFFIDIENEKTQSVISGFIELADKLGINIVAEGIETSEQLSYLCKLNCNVVQGYVFSEPIDSSEFEDLYNLPISSIT